MKKKIKQFKFLGSNDWSIQTSLTNSPKTGETQIGEYIFQTDNQNLGDYKKIYILKMLKLNLSLKLKRLK